jgi:SAM-dependent methyltransferase
MTADFRKRFIRMFWAAHNDSPAVRKALRILLAEWEGGRGLNLGCGDTRIDRRFVNVDLVPTSAVDVVGDARALPFPAGAFSRIVTQETVEHVPDPFGAVREAARVLAADGILYLQAPFVIGYHPGPEDYWRFTRAGIRRLIEQAGLECARVEIAVGAGTGMYRIAVEFLAGFLSRFLPALYLPAKALASLCFYPLVFCDRLLSGGGQSDRIPGGYLAIGIKKQTP